MMFLKGFWEDEDIINVYDDLSIVDLDSENLIHHGLEGSGWVRQTKEHDSGFKETAIGPKGSFPFISFLYTNIVISPSNVKFCEVLGILKGVDEVRDKWWRIAILFGDVI